VSGLFVDSVPELFARNERLVLRMRGARGELALVMVGAAGVGNMTIPSLEIETRRFRGRGVQRERLGRPRRVARGDELACFELGSTVVAVFGPEYAVAGGPAGASVRLGSAMDGRSAGRNEDAAA
jgi:phosphatidylserine decarboxylase